MTAVNKGFFGFNLPVSRVEATAETAPWSVLPMRRTNAIELAEGLTISFSDRPGNPTVLTMRGALDAKMFEKVVANTAQFASNASTLVVDLREVTSISTAGFLALYTVALTLNGNPVHTSEDGWDMIRAMRWDCEEGLPIRLKLIAPQPQVLAKLTNGTERLFEVCA